MKGRKGMMKGNSDTLESFGFQSYTKDELNNLFLAFRNTEPDVFVLTDVSKLTEEPNVKFRIQLPEKNKVFFKKSILSKTQSFSAIKGYFDGCYHNGDGEIFAYFKLKKILAISENESNLILKHPKFNYKSIMIPVYIRLENGRVYLLIDSDYDFEALDADKDFGCFSRVKKPSWNNF
jgi:hypothetical protein